MRGDSVSKEARNPIVPANNVPRAKQIGLARFFAKSFITPLLETFDPLHSYRFIYPIFVYVGTGTS